MKADSLLPHVMVVDDDDDDVLLLTRRLKSAGITNPVLHFRNGGDAFMYLKQFCSPKPSRRAQLPAVMFLDVNMQGLSGFDVLVWARQQPSLEQMKIFMLSGANELWDAQIAAKLGANHYLEKFPEPAALRELLAPVCQTSGAVKADAAEAK